MSLTSFRFSTATVVSVVILSLTKTFGDGASYLFTSSPRFGGCYDGQQQTNTTTTDMSPTYCALKPFDCTTPNSSYLQPHQIRKTNRCHNPHEIPIGRCTSSLDSSTCSAFSESCVLPTKFQQDDVGCNVVRSSWGAKKLTTRYPYCKKPSSDPRCVLNSDECVDGEMFVNTEWHAWSVACYCHDVPTGMCYLDGVSPITADGSLCAVGGYDCPDGYTWMSSAGLLNMVDPPRSCRLCREEDVVGTTVGSTFYESVVESGACYGTDNDIKTPYFLRCALESSECNVNNGEIFVSGPQMYEMGNVPCLADNLAGGECTSTLDGVDCTNRKESCNIPSKFVPRDTCTMHSDKVAEEETWFGYCGFEPRRCVWGPDECDRAAGEVWYVARKDENHLPGCKCEDVRTGACVYGDEGSGNEVYHCAVSRLGCADPSSYVRSGDLKEVAGLDCRLCQPRRVVFMPTSYPTEGPVQRPTTYRPSSTVESPFDKAVGKQSFGDGRIRPSTLVGYALGLMIVITSLAICYYTGKPITYELPLEGNREPEVDDGLNEIKEALMIFATVGS